MADSSAMSSSEGLPWSEDSGVGSLTLRAFFAECEVFFSACVTRAAGASCSGVVLGALDWRAGGVDAAAMMAAADGAGALRRDAPTAGDESAAGAPALLVRLRFADAP